MPTQWSPASILTISQPDTLNLRHDRNSEPKITRVDGLTRYRCAGWAPSQGRECHQPIAKANRHCAAKLLAEMSRMDPLTADFDEELEDLADLILCRVSRHNVKQHAFVVAMWKDDIKKFRRSQRRISGPSDAASPTTTRQRSRRTQREIPVPFIVTNSSIFGSGLTSRDTPVESIERESSIIVTPTRQHRESTLARELLGIDYASTSTSRNTTPEYVTAPASPTIRAIDPVREDRTNESSPIDAATPISPLQPVIEDPEENSNDDAHGNAEEEQEQDNAHDDDDPDEETDEAADEAEEEQHHKHPQRKPLIGDCCICVSPLINTTDFNPHNLDLNLSLTYCRSQCGQNFHTECINLWLATQEDDEREGTCAYCRGAWVG